MPEGVRIIRVANPQKTLELGEGVLTLTVGDIPGLERLQLVDDGVFGFRFSPEFGTGDLPFELGDAGPDALRVKDTSGARKASLEFG